MKRDGGMGFMVICVVARVLLGPMPGEECGSASFDACVRAQKALK